VTIGLALLRWPCCYRLQWFLTKYGLSSTPIGQADEHHSWSKGRRKRCHTQLWHRLPF